MLKKYISPSVIIKVHTCFDIITLSGDQIGFGIRIDFDDFVTK